jgi:hypothetical protein
VAADRKRRRCGDPGPDGEPGARSKQSGQPCRKFPRIKPDGTQCKRCKNHSGDHELLPKGDPRRGGQPPKSFLYVEHLPPERLPVFLEALERHAGSLDYELALARTNLDAFVKRMHRQGVLSDEQFAAVESGGAVDPKALRDFLEGGIEIEWKDGVVSGRKVWPYAQVCLEHLDKIRKLEQAAALLRQTKPPDGDDHEDFQTWLREFGPEERGERPRRSRSRRRS